jgi:hypothetical protein
MDDNNMSNRSYTDITSDIIVPGSCSGWAYFCCRFSSLLHLRQSFQATLFVAYSKASFFFSHVLFKKLKKDCPSEQIATHTMQRCAFSPSGILRHARVRDWNRPARKPRAKDALVTSPHAQSYALDNGATFFVRPPPTPIPPTLPIPFDNAHELPEPGSTEYAHPLLTRPPKSQDGEQPLLRSTTPFAHLAPRLNSGKPAAPSKMLTPAEILELRQLRASDPNTWTRKALADKFGCSESFVGIIGFGKDLKGKNLQRDLRTERRKQVMEIRSQWTPKREMAFQEKKARRRMW